MAIDDIKPPGGYDPLQPPSVDPNVGKSGETRFATSKEELQAPASAESTGFAAAAQFRRTELDDPAKLDVMVRACVSELVDSGRNITGPLSSEHQQSLQDFLAEDPMVRRQIETYLQKVLA